MKRLNKKSVILAALGLLIGGGAYITYQQAQSAATPQMSDLTLANIEALGSIREDDGQIPCLNSLWMCAMWESSGAYANGYNLNGNGIPDIFP